MSKDAKRKQSMDVDEPVVTLPADEATVPETPPEADAPDAPPVGENDVQDCEAERQRRLVAAELNAKLAAKRCSVCTTLGAWKIYDVDKVRGRIRYIRCKACGYCDQVSVVVSEETANGER